MRLSTTPITLGVLVITAALVLTGCQFFTKPLNAHQLESGCDTLRSANSVARGIENQVERNPIRHHDRIVGREVCVIGRARNIKWGTAPDETTLISVITGRYNTAVSCHLPRTDAALVQEGKIVKVQGKIPHQDQVRTVDQGYILDDCRLMTDQQDDQATTP